MEKKDWKRYLITATHGLMNALGVDYCPPAIAYSVGLIVTRACGLCGKDVVMAQINDAMARFDTQEAGLCWNCGVNKRATLSGVCSVCVEQFNKEALLLDVLAEQGRTLLQ